MIESEHAFISCLFHGVSQFTRNYVFEFLNINRTIVDSADLNHPDLKRLWNEGFSTELPCRDPYAPVGNFFISKVMEIQCDSCARSRGEYSARAYSVWLHSPGEQFANGGYDCWGAGCSATYIDQSPSAFCALKGCTTNYVLPFPADYPYPGLAACNASGEGTYCGVCEDGFHCTNVTHLIPVENCESTGEQQPPIVCVLANGTMISTPTAQACQAIGSCTVSCNGGPCLHEQACNAAGMSSSPLSIPSPLLCFGAT